MKQIQLLFALLRQTASDWMSDNAPRLGASLAYYTVFSISPLMVITLAIAELWFQQQVAQEQVYGQLSGLIGPQSAHAIEAILAQMQKPGTGLFATLVAIATLLIGSTGVFVELQDALNTIWGVQPKPSSGWLNFVRHRLLSFAMVLAIGFLLLVSLLLSAALAALGKFLAGFAPELNVFWQILNFVLSFGVITFLFALIFKVLPDVKIDWKDVGIGAVLTSLLFTLGKLLLGLYLGRTGLASSYGAAGSVIVILIWVYYSAQIVFFGAEFTQVYANRNGQNFEPYEYAEPIRPQDKVPAALKRRVESGVVPAELIEPALARPTQHDRRWQIALPLACLFAWAWLHEKRRTRAKELDFSVNTPVERPNKPSTSTATKGGD